MSPQEYISSECVKLLSSQADQSFDVLIIINQLSKYKKESWHQFNVLANFKRNHPGQPRDI